MDAIEAFKEKLDNEHDWPTTYMFKFVVPAAKATEVKAIFSKEKLIVKESKAGNYIAFTLNKIIYSSDEVVEIYREARKVDGLIAL